MPRIMGVVNVTPDSFSDGGQFFDPALAVERGRALAAAGSDILDIGGESTRPGADPVSVDDELARVIPVIEGLVEGVDVLISIDTRKPEVARAAVGTGASIWNDVSALTFDPESVQAAAALSCDIVLMHAQGDPKTMQENPAYRDVVSEVLAYLSGRVELCVAAGIERSRLIIDPGIGFGKTLDHNLALIENLDRFSVLDCPVLLGASRKRFIGAIDGPGPARDRLGGSIAAALAGLDRGAAILRVHDVFETRQALKVAAALKKARLAR